MSKHKELTGRLRELLAHARENWGEYRGLLSLDAALEEVRIDSLSPPDGAGLTRYDLVGFSMEETDNGNWVRYEDAAAALATIPAKPETKP